MIVYGPRFGRTYLVERRHLEDPGFFRAIGLRDPPAVEPLGDPAERIAHTLSDLETIEMNLPPALFRAAYRWLKFSRHFVPLRAMATLIGDWTAFARGRIGVRHRTASELGQYVHGVERAVGISDCYPRALLTVSLCLASRFPCILTVGSLAPTRKMHAWCTTDGTLPYEATPEHYLYQPLWTLELRPGA